MYPSTFAQSATCSRTPKAERQRRTMAHACRICPNVDETVYNVMLYWKGLSNITINGMSSLGISVGVGLDLGQGPGKRVILPFSCIHSACVTGRTLTSFFRTVIMGSMLLYLCGILLRSIEAKTACSMFAQDSITTSKTSWGLRVKSRKVSRRSLDRSFEDGWYYFVTSFTLSARPIFYIE